jgi:hypothetical protein
MRFEAKSKGRINIRDDQRVVLDHAIVYREDYSGRRLLQFASIGSRLEGCLFDRARIESAAFGSGREMSEFIECTFNGARMSMGPGGFARFIRCSFHDVDIRNWLCFAVEMIDCEFSGRLHRAIFNGTVPEDTRAMAGRAYNEFRGNDFSEFDLIDVTFRTGIDLAKQILPSGEDYLYLPDAPDAVKQVRSSIIEWKNLEMRRAAMVIIKGLEYELAGGQIQLLLRPSNYSSISALSRKAVSEVFALLKETGKA